MEKKSESLDDSICRRLNAVADEFFAQNARTYFDKEETERCCLDRTAKVMERIWKGAGKYRPRTVYQQETKEFIRYRGDIVVDLGHKILTTKESYRGISVPSLIRTHAQNNWRERNDREFARKMLSPLPSDMIKRIVIQIPDEKNFFDALVKNYQCDWQQVSRNGDLLDAKTSAVAYRVVMDSFERYLAEYMARTFCKE